MDPASGVSTSEVNDRPAADKDAASVRYRRRDAADENSHHKSDRREQ
jgi:hypothetical protein